jgi:hypothetical protein
MMGKQSGLGDNFYLGGYDLSGDVGAVQTIARRNGLLEVAGINKQALERIQGLRDGEISFNTWFNDDSGQEHDALKGLPRTDVIACYFRGTVLGNHAACLIGKQVNYDWARAPDGALQGTVQVLSQGFDLEWGRMLTPGKRTDTGATNGATWDDNEDITPESHTDFGLAAYLQVFAFEGTDVTVKLQDSANGTDWADLAGFAEITTAPQAQRIETELTATVRRYLRVITVTTEGFNSLVFAVTFSRYMGP